MITKVKSVLFFIIFILSHAIWAQDDISKFEDALINHPDSVQDFDLGSIAVEDDYAKSLIRIGENRASYSDYHDFLISVGSRPNSDYAKLVSFVEGRVKAPKERAIQMDYVLLQEELISLIRDELLDVKQSTVLNDRLEEYVAKSEGSKEQMIRANAFCSIHHIVIQLIQQNIEQGKKMSDELVEKAKSTEDTALIIQSITLQNQFIVYQGNLEPFIENAEYAYRLDKRLPSRTRHFENTLSQLINALIYKRGNDERVIELLQEYYQNPGLRKNSYWLFVQYLLFDPPKEAEKAIYEIFDANDALELCNKARSEIEGEINELTFITFLKESGKLLIKKGFPNAGQEYFLEALHQNKKVYSSQLTEQLATYENQLIQKEKELELKAERKQTQLYIIIASLAILLLLISIFFLYRLVKISNKLRVKNNLITAQRDEITEKEKEKDLLLNELNHRVKNNFQLIIGLMEIQAHELQDIKALEMANEIKNRIRAMAYIHQRLLEMQGSTINFKDYLTSMVYEISKSYHLETEPEIALDLEPAQFNVDTAIPLGLIVNELITNAFKYGFDKENKKLHVDFHQVGESDMYELRVADNGPGLPPDVDLGTTNSIGLKLIRRLSKQLKGEARYERSDFTTFIIKFKPNENYSLA